MSTTPDTPDASVARVVEELGRIAALPLDERAAAFAAVHEQLTTALDRDDDAPHAHP